MSRSLPICFLVAELLLAPTALGKSLQKCLDNCTTIDKTFEKTCKEKSPNGKCEGRGKAMVQDFKKKCEQDCAARQPK